MNSFARSPSLVEDYTTSDRSQILNNVRSTLTPADHVRCYGDPRNVNRDGRPSKRRGPKPDSKPAQTRRQQLNRQAQRSHRERKLEYIKNLEAEITTLRETCFREMMTGNNTLLQNQQYANTLASLKRENDALKRVLSNYGIPYETEPEQQPRANRRSFGVALSTNIMGSPGCYSASTGAETPWASTASNATTPVTMATPDPSPNTTRSDRISRTSPSGCEQQPSPWQALGPTDNCVASLQFNWMDRDAVSSGSMLDRPRRSHQPVAPTRGIFEEDPQLPIDFILTLESPCRNRIDHHHHHHHKHSSQSQSQSRPQFTNTRPTSSLQNQNQQPPQPQRIKPSTPPTTANTRQPTTQQTTTSTTSLPPADLGTLVNLSRQLVADGQLTPAMALQCIRMHEGYPTLNRDNVRVIIQQLYRRIRCYGFGAVVEDWELMDCLEGVLAGKVEVKTEVKREEESDVDLDW